MRALAPILFGTLVLLTPALINGAPFFYFDTGEYARLGRALLAGLHDFDGTRLWMTFLGGRTVSYSFALVLFTKIGGFWLTAVVQSLCGAFVLFWTCRTAVPTGNVGSYFALVVLVAAGTSGGLFTTFLMPDIFLAYGLLATAVLVVGSVPGRAVRLGLWMVLAFSVSAHSTNVAIIGGALVLGIPIQFVVSRRGWRGAFVSESLAVSALVAGLAFVLGTGWAIRTWAGEPLRNPPYLMARVLADGPGREWLRVHCGSSRFAICRYRTKRLDNQNAILWNPDPAVSVFVTADYNERVRLSEEEASFVSAVLRAYPLEMVRAALRNTGAQLITFDAADEMGAARAAWDGPLSAAFPNQDSLVRKSRIYIGGWNWTLITHLHRIVIGIALAYLAFQFGSSDHRQALSARRVTATTGERDVRAAVALIGLLVVVVIANATLCGVLSGVSARYEGRIVWLLPAVALLHALRFGSWKRTTRSTGPIKQVSDNGGYSSKPTIY